MLALARAGFVAALVALLPLVSLGTAPAAAAAKAFQRDDLADAAIKLEAQIKSDAGTVTKSAAASSNPDDFAPAAEPPASGGLGRVKRATDAGVPLYQELAATPGPYRETALLQLMDGAGAIRSGTGGAGTRRGLVRRHPLGER